MSVGNIKNTNDLINKKREYAEYLQLMIDNESIKEKRIKDYKNPNKAPPVPPQYKTASERTKDLYEQEKTAIDNVKELGVDVSEARSFVLQLEQKQDGIDNLVKLNRNFPAFKKLMTDNYRAKDFDSNLLLNAWEGFSVNLNALTGLNSVSSGATNAFSSASDNYMKLPTQNVLIEFKKNSNDVLFTNALLSISDSLKASVAVSIDNAIRLTLDDATVEKINDAITPIEKAQINKLAEQLLSVYKIPTKDEINKIITNIKTSYASLTEDNNVAINDSITKELVILNRYLSVFSDETTSKRLTDYNKFVNDLISGFTSEVKKASPYSTSFETEKTTIKPNVSGISTPKFPNLKNKTEMISYIMNNKIYTIEKLFNIDKKDTEDKILQEINALAKTTLAFKLRQYKKMLEEDERKNRGGLTKIEDSNLTPYADAEEDVFDTIANDVEAFKKLDLDLDQYIMLFEDIVKLKVINELPDDEYKLLMTQFDINKKHKNIDYLIEFIVSLGAGKDNISQTINKYLKKFYEAVISEDNELEARKVERKKVYDELIGLNLTSEDLNVIINTVVPVLVKEPDSKSKLNIIDNLRTVIEDFRNGGAVFDDIIYYICDFILYKDFDFLPYFNAYIKNYPTKLSPTPPPLTSTKKPKEEREAELKLLSKNQLIEINKTLFGKANGKKNKGELIDLIINKEYSITGSGLKKKPIASRGGDLIHIDIGSHIGKNYKEASGKGFNNKNWVNKAEKNYQANGDQPYIKSRIKIGSGVVVDDEPRYQEFGKYVIHIPQLRKNILNIKYRSGSRPQYLPIVNIDDDTKDLIMTTLDTGKMSENQFNKLPEPIKDHLIKAIKGAGLETKFFKNREKIYPTDEKEERDRFNLLKGEFDAGNDNPNLIKELRALVIKFIENCIIPKKQGLEFLRQLN